MELLILVMHDPAMMEKILVRMMEAGIRGGTMLDCEGALQALADSPLKKPPVFSSLQKYLNPASDDKSKLLLSAMTAENIKIAHKIVLEVTGGLDRENTGIFLTVPLGFTDGVGV